MQVLTIEEALEIYEFPPKLKSFTLPFKGFFCYSLPSTWGYKNFSSVSNLAWFRPRIGMFSCDQAPQPCLLQKDANPKSLPCQPNAPSKSHLPSLEGTVFEYSINNFWKWAYIEKHWYWLFIFPGPKLIIPNISKDQGGPYTCIAQNSANNPAFSSTVIDVVCK